jgi:predicted cupin superfamily sugar epimerase
MCAMHERAGLSSESTQTPEKQFINTEAPADASKMELTMPPRAAELVQALQLAPHPEGGWYRELFRSTSIVQPTDARPARAALTSIDFLLVQGQFSAWHRVRSDEAWHLLEGESLTLWLLPPVGGTAQQVVLSAATHRAHVVPAGWWQAAEPGGELAYVGATVGPGFDFADFSFGRDDAGLRSVLQAKRPDLLRLL